MIKTVFLIILCLIIVIVVAVLEHREFFHREIDDVHPLIMDVDNPYLQDSKWVWVIPLYMNDPVSNYPEWVERLKNTGKKIGLHGVYHKHKEFEKDLSDEYINLGINEFQKAFGFYPKYFKAPSLALTKANKKKIKDCGIKIKGRLNQILHKVYHTNDHRDERGWLYGE